MVTQKKLECVIIERKENIGTVILNLPEKRNYLSPDMRRDFAAAHKELQNDDAIDVIITTGAGDIAWSAGMAAQGLLADRDALLRGEGMRRRDFVAAGGDLGVRYSPKVTIAAVNGYCLGAAFGLYCDHDLGIASEEKARFGLPEIMRGTAVGGNINWGGLQHISVKWQYDLALSGDVIDARTAQMIGLVTRIVPHAELRERAFEWAKELSRWDKLCLQYIKTQIRAAQEEPGYLKGQTINMMLSDEYQRINPQGRAGFREFLAKKGAGATKATRLARWVKKE